MSRPRRQRASNPFLSPAPSSLLFTLAKSPRRMNSSLDNICTVAQLLVRVNNLKPLTTSLRKLAPNTSRYRRMDGCNWLLIHSHGQ